MLKHSRFVFIAIFLGMTGCSGRDIPTDLPPLTPCKLTLTQDGAPLAKARIVLEPTEESKWFPGGTTDENGTTWLMTNGRYKGAPVGKYKITVRKTETEPSKLGPEPPLGTPENVKWVEDSGKEKRASFSFVEEKYGKADSTPLEIEIPDKKTVTATFDVGKKIREQIKYVEIKER